MYRINKSYIEKCLRIIEKSYKDNRFDLYVNGVLYKRALNNFEVRDALEMFHSWIKVINSMQE